jgi:hypothetical protein
MKRPFWLVAVGSFLGLTLVGCEQPAGSRQTPIRADAASTGQALTDYAQLGAPADPSAPVQPQSAAPTTSGPLTFYTDRATFVAQFPDLPLEDFEKGKVPDRSVSGCPGPVDATNNNQCFSPGDIKPGVEFNSDHRFGPNEFGLEIALLGRGFAGNPSRNIIANFFVDAFIIDFTGGNVTATGMDLVAYFSADNCQIDVFGASGLLGSTTAPCTNQGAFWGVTSDEAITRIRVFSPTNQAEGVDNISFGEGFIRVVIDIKPGSDPNSINPRNNGVIPVALLSSTTFDAMQVDVSTVAFGPGGAPVAHGGHVEDVNGDGLPDMVFQFDTQASGLSCGDVQATLTGRTLAGRRFKGTDAVNMVNCGTKL